MTKISHRLIRVLSGTPLAMAFRAAGSFNCSLTSIGSGKYTIPLKGTRYSPATWQSATQHWFSMIGEYWDDVPMYYGLIADKFFDFQTEVLTLDTVTVDDLFENRYTFGVGTYEAGDLSITSQSLRAALIQVLKRGTGWGGNWGLPFNYRTPQVEGGPFSQTWRYHDWKRISDLRRFIQSMDGGPDLAFIPRADASFNASWDVYAGNPRIDGPTIDLPLSVAKPNAQKVVLGERGRAMQSGAFVRGEGGGAVRATGAGRPIGQAGFIGGPTMAVRDAARDMVANDSNLDSIALGDLKKNRKPIEQWDLELILGREKNPLPIADFGLGSRLNLRHSGNAYREAEKVTQYVVAFSHNTSEPLIVKPEVQTL